MCIGGEKWCILRQKTVEGKTRETPRGKSLSEYVTTGQSVYLTINLPWYMVEPEAIRTVYIPAVGRPGMVFEGSKDS